MSFTNVLTNVSFSFTNVLTYVSFTNVLTLIFQCLLGSDSRQ